MPDESGQNLQAYFASIAKYRGKKALKWERKINALVGAVTRKENRMRRERALKKIEQQDKIRREKGNFNNIERNLNFDDAFSERGGRFSALKERVASFFRRRR